MSAHDIHSGSESEDDFNPQPEIDDEDIGDRQTARPRAKEVVEDDDDEDTEQAAAPRNSGATEGAGDDDDEGEDEADDDDEEDEEEEEEDEVVGRSRKRRKRDARMQFIDVEAEVDEDEEEEEEEDDVPDEIHPDDLLEAAGPDLDDRRHRELDRKREAEADLDAEQVAAQFDQKYRRREIARGQKAAGPTPLDLPTVDDPSIWGVKCKPGKEKDIIFAIMKRMEQRQGTQHPLRIFSAFERGGAMAGYIYVEANGKQDMLDAMADIPNVYTGSGPIAIEVKERPDLLRKRKKDPLNPNDWVRMKRPPLYAGDLAQIYEVNSNGLDCVVKLVPRLDYGLHEDINAAPDANKRKRGAAAAGPRPPPRLFNEADAKKKHMKFLSQIGSAGTKSFQYKNEDYTNGLLIKEVKISHFTKKDVNPTMAEMQLFARLGEDGNQEIDLIAVQAAQRATTTGSSFVPGDNVEIFEGEQKGVNGTTVSVTGDIVTLKVTSGELKGQSIEAPVKTLRKLFREGDHVKVIGGSKYIDEVGLVTKIRDDKVTLLSDSTQQEITVFSKDLKRAADSAQLGNDSDFQLSDLVQLDAATVGYVIKVDREIVRVLDQNGSVRNLLNSQISSVIPYNRNAVATDKDGSEIRQEDMVKEIGGEDRVGKVVLIHRGYLYINNPTVSENNSIFVVKSGNVTTMAAKSGRTQAAGPDLSKMNPTMMQGANGAAMAPPRTIGRDKMIGKTVTVRKGNYKGLLGIVRDSNGSEARIELHTKNKVISLPKDLLIIKDPITGNTIDFNGKLANRSRGMPTSYGSGTPSTRTYGAGGQTPSWGGGGQSSRGPSWGTPHGGGGGGRTPAWNNSNRTPAWNGAGNDGSRTSYGGNDGSRTAYGGNDGSRTAYGGATAYGGNDGNRTAYGGANSGGRTPGGPTWGAAPSGSKTPSHASNGANSYSSNTYAPTPGAYQQAPTPAAYNSYVGAPTPGGGPMDAPTPGFSAPTPGDTAHHPTPRGYGGYGGGYGATPAAAPTPGAPTPGAWQPETPWNNPETPAAGDDEPRYE
ncbi:transcription elongation factor Spt5 [Lophium mytilinum]|uniref:Transcription elongation factor SPT5 n=1 Tax=Lophium mytilinum TaxID=390894 RepID=A0A6A6RBG4_9PEZI|nr:transcription elongation factor Spt5 [Lophium mytilinum]